MNPFFPPDGKWLGFYSDSGGKLMKVPVAGDAPTTILTLSEVTVATKATAGSTRAWPFGASWGSNNTIVFAPEMRSGLWKVSASGGKAEQITLPDKEVGEVSHRLPQLLPGGKAVIFTVYLYTSFAKGTEQIVVQHLETGERRVLVENGTDGRDLPTGHLVFAREGTLMAVPFDLVNLTLNGASVRVLEGVSHSIFTGGDVMDSGAAQFTTSASGSLAYIAGSVFPESKRQVVWLDRSGKVEATKIPPGRYNQVRLSPNNSEALLARGYKQPNIWRYDFPRGTLTIETPDGHGTYPEWTPDGTGFVFASGGFAFSPKQAGFHNLFRRSIGSVDAPQQLTASEDRYVTGAWHPDGNRLTFMQKNRGLNWDIWILPTQGSLPPEPLLRTPFFEAQPAFSPDGRLLAYYSLKSGSGEVYVRPYPGPGQEKTISPSGGLAPAWAGSGRELFYCSFGSPVKMFAVDIRINGDTLSVGSPVVLFHGKFKSANGPNRSYDVTSDGQRFLVIQKDEAARLAMEREFFRNKVSVVLNWSEELRRLAPSE